MAVIIDYGIGNLRSVQKAVEAVGHSVKRSRDPTDLLRADKLILPGVGAFGSCADALRQHDLEEPLLQAVEAGVPLLGVCVGMQLLFEGSEEMGSHRGLGLLPGSVVRFAPNQLDADRRPLKVPHMGWNSLDQRKDVPLLKGITSESYVYYVHSYYAAADPDDVLASSSYGLDFPAVVGRNRIFGVQFHPEKSQQAGLQILRNFLDMAS